jgi:ubiquinol-cytochrome c reductase cytochrome b subunit
MIERLRNIALWIDERVYISKLFAATAGHPVPRKSGSWFNVLGSGTLLCFVIQIVTGICLALIYVPSASEAYSSLEYLNYQQQLGWFLRAMHNWGSNFMVAIMLLHMIQGLSFGVSNFHAK